MKKFLACGLITVLLSASVLRADTNTPTPNAEPPAIVLRALLEMGDEISFSLSEPSGENSRWVTPGGVYAGWTVGAYDAKTKTLTLEKDGETQHLRLASASELDGEAGTAEARAEAEEIFRLINFEKMMREMMAKQKEAMLQMQRQAMEQSGEPVDERMLEIQASAFDEINNLMDWNAMANDMIDIYAETFTAGELKGISDFYATPAGQAVISKTPEVQQRTMEVIMPRMMEVMPAVQQKTAELMQQYQAEKAAAQEQATQQQ
ncbi:DUF2059 domain-containing protein [Ruficoccus sp. ZRK36]|uniref:DUF2059 domain-containing protein n=1 Tax=Ruficoccus sp. ZRK36 TaxID=2866311 RepID=UPI001C72AA8F|nr:DUF2059 domain-containing protein [Ruficoccus sp. ZRK36]QYY37221.1 DUF2059 domain-containing protein [Ruficoccus sp. ZRK36]